MITRHGDHGSFAKQLLKEGSMGGGFMKVSHHTYSSGENMSPRSVLEQRALSGLAIAIDLEEKMKLSHTQENVILGRYLSKQSIMHMSLSTQEGHAKENGIGGRFLSRERLSHMGYMHHDERETVSGESCVGLKMVISMHQMSNQEGKADEKLMMGRSLSRERTRHMMDMNDEEEERERALDGSNGGLSMGASLGGERKQDNEGSSDKKVSSSEDPPLKSPLASPCRNSCQKEQNTWWLHQLGHVQPSFRPAMEDSIFYYASADRPPPPSSTRYQDDVDDGCQACSPVEDFLKCCFFCKRNLGAGKDIYMYRGDQAFCSVECRYQQIAKDEYVGASAL